MALTTYSELKDSIADFLNRDDLTSVIPDFITLAEAQMNREVRHWRMEKRATANLDTQYTALPNDFLQPIRFVLQTDPVITLEQTDSRAIANLRASNNDQSGKPTDYSILDSSIEVFPTPDATYTIQLNYILKDTGLSSTNTQTYISKYFPNGLLYACLVEAYSFLKGPNDLLQLYEGKYKQVVEGFSIEQMGRRRRDEYQSGVPRVGGK